MSQENGVALAILLIALAVTVAVFYVLHYFSVHGG
jgi:hypothetical protein